MTDIRHYIDGNDFGEPRNWQDIEITMDWLNKKESGTVNVSDLDFVGEANEFLQKRIMDGMTGGVGAFEGIPYQIKIGENGANDYVFDGYLDATDDPIVFGGEEITLGLKKVSGDDWLNDVADGFSFAYLYEIGVITDADFVKVPYVINYIPDGPQLIIISLSIFMITKEIIENAQSVSKAIAVIVNAGTPVIGVGAGAGAVAVTAWDLGDYIDAALSVVAKIVYDIAMNIAMIKLIDQLFDQIIQKKRNHLGMTFTKMMEKGCEHLGLRLESKLLQQSEFKNWVHIPRKDKKGGTSGEKGFPTNTEAIYLFGNLIRTLKEDLNAEHRIRNGVLYFERKDNFKIPSSYSIPHYFVNQERVLDEFTLNTNEIIANYNISWQLDVQDQNTLENSAGRVFQAITSPKRVINQKMVTIKGLQEIAIPFSMGLDKKNLTAIEESLKVLGSIVDAITGIFGNGTNFKSKVESRIGALLLSSHFTTIGKVVVMNGSKLVNDQRKVLDARNIWDNYHYINSFAEVNGVHNQFKRFKEQPVPMDFEDFSILLDSNFGTTESGQDYEIEKVVYNREERKALIDYRVKFLYTNNLQIKYI